MKKAQAISHEHALAGGKVVGVAPVFVEAEYEVVAEADKPPRVKFNITLRTEQAPEKIHARD